jgi:hypothetical protein
MKVGGQRRLENIKREGVGEDEKEREEGEGAKGIRDW